MFLVLLQPGFGVAAAAGSTVPPRPSVPQASPAWRREPVSEFSALFEARTDTFQTLPGPTPISTGRNARVSSSEPQSQTWLPRRVWKKQLTFPST